MQKTKVNYVGINICENAQWLRNWKVAIQDAKNHCMWENATGKVATKFSTSAVAYQRFCNFLSKWWQILTLVIISEKMCFIATGNSEKRKTERWNISTVGSISHWHAPPSLISIVIRNRRQGAANTAHFTDVILVSHRHDDQSQNTCNCKALLYDERTVLNHYKWEIFSFFILFTRERSKS